MTEAEATRIELKPIDWPQMISDLQNLGLGWTWLQQRSGIPRTTLIRYNEGSEPGYKNGERLIACWVHATTRGKDQLPRVA